MLHVTDTAARMHSNANLKKEKMKCTHNMISKNVLSLRDPFMLYNVYQSHLKSYNDLFTNQISTREKRCPKGVFKVEHYSFPASQDSYDLSGFHHSHNSVYNL